MTHLPPDRKSLAKIKKRKRRTRNVERKIQKLKKKLPFW